MYKILFVKFFSLIFCLITFSVQWILSEIINKNSFIVEEGWEAEEAFAQEIHLENLI